MSFCGQCRAPLSRGARFCSQCGAEFQETPACPGCGRPCERGQSFCAHCGTALGAPPPAPPSPARRPDSPPPKSQPTAARISRWWPASASGNLLYLAVIASLAGLGFALATRDPNLDGKEWIMAGGMALSALMILTIWRNILISNGLLARKQVVVDDGGNVQTTGGIHWWGIILLVIALALIKYAGDRIKKNVKLPRLPTPTRTPLQR